MTLGRILWKYRGQALTPDLIARILYLTERGLHGHDHYQQSAGSQPRTDTSNFRGLNDESR